MAFSLEIKNFGKLADATIHIGNLTILAGPNNTGKSHVSKLLYSLFDAMNAEHVNLRLNSLVRPVQARLADLEVEEYGEDEFPLSILHDHIEEMRGIAKSCSADNDDYDDELDAINQLYPDLTKIANKMRSDYQRLKPVVHNYLKENAENRLDRDFSGEDTLIGIGESINSLNSIMSNMNAYNFLVGGIESKIRQNLLYNFQVPNLSILSRKREEISEINIDGEGKFLFEKNRIEFEITQAGLRQWQQYSRVIYLESPLYWKLKSALDNLARYPRFFSRSGRARLIGIPGYFYDLARAISEEFPGDVAFPERLKMLTNIVGGEIQLSKSGDLSFMENERNFPMHLAATGIANLGILALLIEKKVLDKGAFLFIDEPEAHLHPAWQVIMAETLFELARNDVNVVIATHSADILKWIEEWVRANPDDQKFVALNQFSANGIVTEDDDFETKLANIKGELTKPFADLYLGGLPKQ